MGLFDFLFAKKPQPTAEADVDAPRCGHYMTAHLALRSLALQRPLMFFGVLASDDKNNFLQTVLDMVQEDCQAQGEPLGLHVSDLKVHPGRVGKYPLVMIEMPPPERVAEAFFVAAVMFIDLDDDAPPPEKPPVRYFTLERSMLPETGESGTVVCEWTDEAHYQLDHGPEPTIENFVRAIQGHLA